jgi:large subunit ribosomal protein L7/L12
VAITRDEVVAYLGALGPGELQDLILELEDLWGMEPAYTGPVHVTMGAPLDDPWEMGIPEYEVVLLSSGARRVQVMKALREEVTTLGLAEVRAMVEQTPSVILRGVSQREANALQQALEAVGAKVEIR